MECSGNTQNGEMWGYMKVRHHCGCHKKNFGKAIIKWVIDDPMVRIKSDGVQRMGM